MILKKPLPMNTPRLILAALCGTGLFLMASCGKDPNDPGLEYMPDMYRSPSYEVYSKNPNFSDSLTLQAPVKGSIPRGYTFFAYPDGNEGYEAAGRDVRNPLSLTEANLAEGERRWCNERSHRRKNLSHHHLRYQPDGSACFADQSRRALENCDVRTQTSGTDLGNRLS
ncbi:MAG: hypothetical protein LW707_09590 [Sphingobacteriales bacterium]|nr:hypothetical protein [Sphingobacteriales bacterium]